MPACLCLSDRMCTCMNGTNYPIFDLVTFLTHKDDACIKCNVPQNQLHYFSMRKL